VTLRRSQPARAGVFIVVCDARSRSDGLPAMMRPNGGDEHAGVVPRMPGVRAELRPDPEVQGEPRRVMEGCMGEDKLRVVEVTMVEAVATAEVEVEAQPAGGSRGRRQAQQDRAERDQSHSHDGPSHRWSPSEVS
jgi:hypothetical protein